MTVKRDLHAALDRSADRLTKEVEQLDLGDAFEDDIGPFSVDAISVVCITCTSKKGVVRHHVQVSEMNEHQEEAIRRLGEAVAKKQSLQNNK